MNKLFDRFFSMISLIAVAMITVPIALMLLGGTFPDSGSILPAYSIICTFFGYFAQHIIASAANKKASTDGFGSFNEGILNGFSMKYAGIPITVFIILSVIAVFVYDGIMDGLCQSGVIEYHSMVYSICFGAVTMLSCMAGCVIWFYPIERLANMYILMASCAVFFGEFALMLLTSRGAGAISALGVMFGLFLICMLIVFNQRNIQQKYRGSVVSVLTPSARMYNLFLVFLLLLMLLAVLAVSYVVVSGLYLIGKFFAFIILYKLFYNANSDPSEFRTYEVIDGDEASEMLRNQMFNQDERILLSYFFVGTLTFLAVIVGLKTGVLKKAFAAIRAWIIEFFTTIFIGLDIYRVSFNPDAEEESYNYKDEKKRLQKAEIRDYNDMAEATDSYKAFLTRLGKLKTYDEQLCYAYAVLLRMYKKMNVSLKLSDTPREVDEKVKRALSGNEIDRITADFESVRYAENEKTDAEAQAILTNICSAVKRYLF